MPAQIKIIAEQMIWIFRRAIYGTISNTSLRIMTHISSCCCMREDLILYKKKLSGGKKLKERKKVDVNDSGKVTGNWVFMYPMLLKANILR